MRVPFVNSAAHFLFGTTIVFGAAVLGPLSLAWALWAALAVSAWAAIKEFGWDVRHGQSESGAVQDAITYDLGALVALVIVLGKRG